MTGREAEDATPLDRGLCERCGEERTGRRIWMWHQGDLLPEREFYCDPCRKRMRLYGILALVVFVVGFGGTMTWLLLFW